MNNPIVIPMTIQTTIDNYAMSVEGTTESYSMSPDTAINVSLLPVATYDGSYTITPLANEDQVMETSGLLMTDDVTILQVPYFETTNTKGKTVYIASEV